METFRIEDLDIDYPVYLVTSTYKKYSRTKVPMILNFKESILDESSTYSRANYLKCRGSEQERSFQGHNEVGTFGVKFYREIPFIIDKRSHPEIERLYYRVDFYCPELNLIVELNDDNTHTPEGDEQRYKYLRYKGYTVLPIYRFQDNLVKNVELVRNTIDELRRRNAPRIIEDYSYLEELLNKTLSHKKQYVLSNDDTIYLSKSQVKGLRNLCRLFPTLVDDMINNSCRNLLITESDLDHLDESLSTRTSTGSRVPSSLLSSIMEILRSKRIRVKFSPSKISESLPNQENLEKVLGKRVTKSKFDSYCTDVYKVSKSHPKFLDDLMAGSGASYKISLSYLARILDKKPEISRVDYVRIIMSSLGVNLIIEKRVPEELELEVTRIKPGFYIPSSSNESIGIRSYIALLSHKIDGVTRYLNMLDDNKKSEDWIKPNDTSLGVSTPYPIKLSQSESEKTKSYYKLLLKNMEAVRWCIDRGFSISIGLNLKILLDTLEFSEEDRSNASEVLNDVHKNLILPLDNYRIYIILTAGDEYSDDICEYYSKNPRDILRYLSPHKFLGRHDCHLKILDSWYTDDFTWMEAINGMMFVKWRKTEISVFDHSKEELSMELDERYYKGRRDEVLPEISDRLDSNTYFYE